MSLRGQERALLIERLKADLPSIKAAWRDGLRWRAAMSALRQLRPSLPGESIDAALDELTRGAFARRVSLAESAAFWCPFPIDAIDDEDDQDAWHLAWLFVADSLGVSRAVALAAADLNDSFTRSRRRLRSDYGATSDITTREGRVAAIRSHFRALPVIEGGRLRSMLQSASVPEIPEDERA